jgi:type I restriction enzyme S subunit
MIPVDWAVKTLCSVLNKGHLGGNYPNQDRETSYPLMKMGNIDRGYIDTHKVEYISPGITPDPLDRLRCGDILFNTRNTLDLVGKVAIWRGELPVAYFNSNLMRLEFNPDEVCSNEYANYALNSFLGISRLRALATGTTSVAAIYTRDLLQLPFIDRTSSVRTARHLGGAVPCRCPDCIVGQAHRQEARHQDGRHAAAPHR